MKISKLKYFLVVAEELNITRAARRLYITQQSLSENIAQLEQEYRVQLFRRKPNIQLTRAGHRFVILARQLISLDEHIRDEMAGLAHQNVGSLSIGVRRPYSEILLPYILPQFRAEHPNVELHVAVSSTAAMAQLLAEGKIDLCLGLGRYLKNRNFNVTELWSDRYCVVIPENILREDFQMTGEEFLSGRELDFQGLRDIPLILRDNGSNCRATSDLFLLHHGIENPNVLAELRDPLSTLRYCTQGCGVTFALEKVTRHFAKHHRLHQKLYSCPIENSALDAATVICFHKGCRLSSAAQDLISLIQRAAASGEYF